MTMETIGDADKQLVYSDSSIFNYMKTNIFFDFVISQNQIRFQNLELTNDPYEYTTLSGYSAPYSNLKILSSSERRFCIETVREISRLRKRMCIGCFCMNEDQSHSFCNSESGEVYNAQAGYSHSRMWSQYGEDHKGVCLLFNRDQLMEELKANFKKLLFANKIAYKQNQIMFPEYEDIEPMNHLSPQEAAIQYLSKEKHQMQLLFTKDIDYEREQEFRIAFYSDQNYEYVNLKALKAIIVGPRFPNDKISDICEVGSVLKIGIYKNNYLGDTSYLTNLYPLELTLKE